MFLRYFCKLKQMIMIFPHFVNIPVLVMIYHYILRLRNTLDVSNKNASALFYVLNKLSDENVWFSDSYMQEQYRKRYDLLKKKNQRLLVWDNSGYNLFEQPNIITSLLLESNYYNNLILEFNKESKRANHSFLGILLLGLLMLVFNARGYLEYLFMFFLDLSDKL